MDYTQILNDIYTVLNQIYTLLNNVAFDSGGYISIIMSMCIINVIINFIRFLRGH